MLRQITLISGAPFEAVERASTSSLRESGQRVVSLSSADDPVQRFAERARTAGVEVHTYGESSEADNRVEVISTTGNGWTFEVVVKGVRTARFNFVPVGTTCSTQRPRLSGGLGLFGVGELSDGLAAFSGTRRRLSFADRPTVSGAYDDSMPTIRPRSPRRFVRLGMRSATAARGGVSGSPLPHGVVLT